MLADHEQPSFQPNILYSDQKHGVLLFLLETATRFPPASDIVEHTDQETQPHIVDYRTNFAQAEHIVLICGSLGLGDSVILLRHLLPFAQQEQRPVTIQIHPALMPFMEPWSLHFPHIRFCTTVTEQELFKPQTFIINPFRNITAADPKRGRWLADPAIERGLIDKKLDRLVEDHWVLDDIQQNRHLYTLKHSEDITAPLNKDVSKVSSAIEFYTDLMVKVLGLDINSEQILHHSILSVPTLETATQHAPTYDFFMVPDALESECIDSDGITRSEKSLPLTAWDGIFEKLAPETKVAIAIGTAHPEYCQKVIDRAKKHNLLVTVFQGSLTDFSKVALASAVFFGMDSGTTHLAVELAKIDTHTDWNMQIVQYFNEMTAPLADYALPESAITLAYSIANGDSFNIKIFREQRAQTNIGAEAGQTIGTLLTQKRRTVRK